MDQGYGGVVLTFNRAQNAAFISGNFIIGESTTLWQDYNFDWYSVVSEQVWRDVLSPVAEVWYVIIFKQFFLSI